MPLLLAAALAAHAATWTPEDLVVAHARGLPAETTARLAESVGLDEATAVYLLRRGVPGETLAAWGHPVSEAEGMAALRAGPLDAPAPSAERVARVDAAALDTAIATTAAERDPLPLERRALLERRGHGRLVGGVLLAVAGGVTLAAGAKGQTPGPDWWTPSMGDPRQTLLPWDTVDSFWGVQPAEPNVAMMGVGAAMLLGGGVTLHFGARDLRLAGTTVDPWANAE